MNAHSRHNLCKRLVRGLVLLIVAAAIGSATTRATAAGLIIGQEVNFSGPDLPGPFSDTFSFTLGVSAGINSVSSWANIPVAGITGFDVTLRQLGGGDIASDTQTTFTGSLLQSEFYVPILAPGNYTISFSGLSTGMLGGSYSSTLQVVTSTLPVPEPETWAMLAAGLCLVGAIIRRRTALGRQERAVESPSMGTQRMPG